MRKIRIISGTYGFHENGIVNSKNKSSTPFDVLDDEAKRIVSLGIAEYADNAGKAVATPASEDNELVTGENSAEPKSVSESEESGEINAPEYSINSPASELRAIAKSVGITFKIGTTKEDMVAVLDEYFKNDVEMPDISAADPE